MKMPRLLRRTYGSGGAFQTLSPYAAREWPLLVGAGIATVLVVALELVRPWTIKVVLDQVILDQPWNLLPASWLLPENKMALLIGSCAALVLVAALGAVIVYVRTVWLAQAGHQVVARVRKDLYAHLLNLSPEYHGGQRAGDLLARLTGDAAMLKILLVEGIFFLGQEVVAVIGVAAVMLLVDVRMALLALLVVPPISMIVIGFGGKIRAAARRQRKKEGLISTTASEALAGVETIQAFGLEKRAVSYFRRQNGKGMKAGVAAARLEGMMGRWAEVTISVGTAVILFTGAGRVLNGILTPGELIVLISYVRALYKPMRRFATRSAKVFKSAAGGERIIEVLRTKPDLPIAAHPVRPAHLAGEIRFSRVGYTYPDGQVALKDVDLHVRPGELVVLTGPNGGGKSTLVSLIPRLRDVTKGAVQVDNHDVRTLDLDLLRGTVGMVLQRPVLFDGTVEENVRMSAPDASDAEVQEAMFRTGADSDDLQVDGASLRAVGELGGALSGGQAQRIALARALVRRPSVLILDEPTASLDKDAWSLLFDRLLPWAKERGATVLIVSHDPLVIRRAGRVVVLERGRLVYDGAPSGAPFAPRAVVSGEALVGAPAGRHS